MTTQAPTGPGFGFDLQGAPPWLTTLSNYVITEALSGLTGVRAFIPIFMVALGSKIWQDEFPLVLDESFWWLSYWPTIFLLGCLLILEVVGDCIPLVDEAMDVVMLVVKPILAIILALAPHYGNQFFHKILAAGASCGMSLMVAVAKSVETAVVDVSTAGVGAPVRSAIEDASVVGLVGLTLIFFIGALLVLAIILVFVVTWCCRRQHKKRRRRRQNQEASVTYGRGPSLKESVISFMCCPCLLCCPCCRRRYETHGALVTDCSTDTSGSDSETDSSTREDDAQDTSREEESEEELQKQRSKGTKKSKVECCI